MTIPQVHIDEEAQDGGEETPDGNGRAGIGHVRRNEGDERQPAEQPDKSVARDEATQAGRGQIQHHDRHEVEVWRHIDEVRHM